MSFNNNMHACAQSLQSRPTVCNPVTAAHQAPLSMGFSREEYWSRWPFPSPKDLTNPGMELGLLQAGSLPSEPWGKPQVSGKWWIFAPMRISEHSSLLFGMRALSRKL